MPKDTSSRAKCESVEISHLIKKGYDRDRAVAAAKKICKDVKKNELISDLLSTTIKLKEMQDD